MCCPKQDCNAFGNISNKQQHQMLAVDMICLLSEVATCGGGQRRDIKSNNKQQTVGVS